jgi:ubiquitination network signaling protein AcrB
MPRSGAGKKNQHNHRHENGLVGPGKRISKQRSNGQLNAPAKDAVPDTPPLTPTASLNPLMKSQVANDSNASLSDAKQDGAGSSGIQGLRKRGSESSADGQNLPPHGSIHGRESDEAPSRRYHVSMTKQTSSNDIGTLQLASTILKSCPAYDTIAMLILLLQLPPIFLTLVQALFASLTFMPPSGLSMTSVFSLFDVFQGSAGTPSLGTMIAVDALCLGGWFCLWNWARNFALDLAQVQIAITLGGGNAGKPGSVNSICIIIVLLLHLVRSKSVRHFCFEHIVSSKLLASGHVAHLAQYMPHEADFGSTPQPPSWYRSLFAIHIITQAGIAIIRRNVASSQAGSISKISKRVDTEASAGAQSNQDISGLESGSGAISPGAIDSHSPQTPGFKDGKDRAMSAKKRRRQANQVRSRQPFWAALASTKVNAMREIEISRPSSKASSIAGDEIADMLSMGEGHIRIIHVDSSSIKFEAIHLNSGLEDQEAGPSVHHDSLFVRINGAYWTSTSMSTSRTDQAGTVRTGEISGLAPNCTYTCSFNRDDGQEIAVITVKTPAFLDKDQVSSMSSLSSLPFRHTQRPSSPTTTIRQSITTNEAKLSDTKARVSRTRRSHKAALSKVEKEVESFSSRLKSSSDDTKQRQKLLQAERTMKQNEDATQSISAALDDLSSIPEEDANGYSSRKAAFERQCALLAAANESLSSATSTADAELANLSEELKATNRQRERLLARQSRLSEQQERITQANLQGLNEKERKAEETLAKERDHARIESEYTNQFAIFHRELASLCMRLQQAKQESQLLESQMINQQHNSIIGNGPLTPEGNLPGTNPITRPPQPPAFGHGFPTTHTMTTLAGPSVFPEPAHVSPFQAYSKQPVAFQPDHHNQTNFNSNRARSASNRSGGAVSNYSADFEDADPIPPMPGATKFNAEPRRTGSGGSPAGGGSVSPTVAVNVGVVGFGRSLRTNANANANANANPNANMSRRESPGHVIW